MAAFAIEINDVGLTVADARGMHEPSPGYAVLDGTRLRTGAEALAMARLEPRRSDCQFWDRLSNEVLSQPALKPRSYADLVHAHLGSLWDRFGGDADTVMLAVPATLSRDQMGLLLGIAQACGMPVRGLVDAAVASAYNAQASGKLLHLDIQLHRVALTELEAGDRVRRVGVEVRQRGGWAALRDEWVRLIADLFVRRTRFDPLTRASSEQALYDKLDTWLAALAAAESSDIMLESGGEEHTITLQREQLVAPVSTDYERMLELVRSRKHAGETVTLLVSDRVARLPGLSGQLAALPGCHVVSLPPGAAATGALALEDAIVSDEATFALVADVPAAAAGRTPAQASSSGTAAAEGQPTHVVYAGIAYELDASELLVGTDIPAGRRGIAVSGQVAGISRTHCSVFARDGAALVDDHSTYGSYLNGQRIDGLTRLGIGDVLRVGSPGVSLTLIALENRNGT